MRLLKSNLLLLVSGVEPNFHERDELPNESGITALSKSSIYVIPSPFITLEVPGTILANSELKFIFDFSLFQSLIRIV